MSNPHQDWNTVIIHGKNIVSKNKKTTKKPKSKVNSNTTNDKNMRKLDDEQDSFKHERVSKKVTTAIMQGRMAKKLTQANLAAALSLKVDIIRSYESGKAIPNNLILTKMQKILGVKLTGLNKGTKK